MGKSKWPLAVHFPQKSVIPFSLPCGIDFLKYGVVRVFLRMKHNGEDLGGACTGVVTGYVNGDKECDVRVLCCQRSENLNEKFRFRFRKK